MIARAIGSGAGIAGMVQYITHDQTSAADPKPKTSERRARGLQRWAEQYERDHGGIVVPARVKVRETLTARRDTTRRCRNGGMTRDEAWMRAAQLHPWPRTRRASRKPPAPSHPAEAAEWRQSGG